MNKEKVLEIVNDVINDRITQMIEEISTNEFVDMICDKIHEETGFDVDDDDKREEVSDLIGSRVLPLLHKMSEYIIGVEIPIK